MIVEICSYCHLPQLKCTCENFHPPMRMLMAQDKPEVLILDREEVLALQEYFYKYAGYISYEHNPEVHKVIKKIDGFVGRVK